MNSSDKNTFDKSDSDRNEIGMNASHATRNVVAMKNVALPGNLQTEDVTAGWIHEAKTRVARADDADHAE